MADQRNLNDEYGELIGFACYDTTKRGFFGPTGVSEVVRAEAGRDPRRVGDRLHVDPAVEIEATSHAANIRYQFIVLLF